MASNNTYEQERELYKSQMNVLPNYVQDYIEYKSRKLSSATLRAYVIDFIDFFTWIKEIKTFGEFQHISLIPLSVLEQLRSDMIERKYLTYLNNAHRDRIRAMKTRKKRTVNDMKSTSINRKLSSLKSLFYWLSNIAEDENLKPLLNRNVMAKIELDKIKTNIKTKAQALEGKILIGDQIDDFIRFIRDEYPNKINSKLAVKKYNENVERDIAIVSLILSAGLRIAEVSNLDLSDLDLAEEKVYVLRKGEKEQFVPFSSIAKKNIQHYLEIRNVRYNSPKDEQALFLTKQQQPYGVRMTKRAMQLMIEKYAKAFGKPMLSAHKLRHSMATRHYQKNKDIASLKDHLGHESIETTMIYTHVLSSDQKDKIEYAERGED
ncbi:MULTISPECIES: tyrosine recombinase XerS [Cytobacillus]|uniref:Site-specific recombinase XerD n=1 Tax=Cytobacillus oceanisediminis TaxID=665099 RepID=A0ABX3CN35_9BACI|nr:tyrosine recombinase XerS [Cytobacillus oceanisediminis]MCM3402826.1 tyrosine recombinase XerS [Cytobacillus oceanisediminis]OHX44610.1 hypothetical protein BBV17_25650 [Cytobacillus oceanisediminis]